MSQKRLLRSKNFYPLFWTQFWGAVNDNFFKNILVIFVAYRTDVLLGLPSSQLVIVAGGLFMLPFFLFSGLAGQLADKFEKSRLIKWAKVFELLAMSIAATALWINAHELLLFSLFLMGLQTALFTPLKYSALPQLLPEKDLVTANSLLEAATFVAILLGTLIAGVVVFYSKSSLVPASLFVVFAALGLRSSLKVPTVQAAHPTLQLEIDPIFPTLKIVKSLRSQVSILSSVLALSWFWAFGSSVLTLIPIYCRETLQSPEVVTSVFIGLFAVGVACGSLACDKMSKNKLNLGISFVGALGLILFSTIFYFINFFAEDYTAFKMISSLWLTPLGIMIVSCLFAISFFSGLFIVPLNTLIQERTEKIRLARVVAANNIINSALMVLLSVALFFLYRMGVNISQIFLVLALANVVFLSLMCFYFYEYLAQTFFWVRSFFTPRCIAEGLLDLSTQNKLVIISTNQSVEMQLDLLTVLKRPLSFSESFEKLSVFWEYQKKRMLLSADENSVILVFTQKEFEADRSIHAKHFVINAEAQASGRSRKIQFSAL